ncbi:hydroxymethylglutaryl-CoA reductase, degradative [Lacticaseibacillus suihuaensis]
MKFYQLTPDERRKLLVDQGHLTPADAALLAQTPMLAPDVAAHLIENQIGQFALPLGVVRDLVVNGQTVQVPLVTEEPSVVAAANNGARIAALNGGVTATAPLHRVIGEVVFDAPGDWDRAAAKLRAHEPEIRAVAAAAHPSIVRRGGGLDSLTVTRLGDFLKLSLSIDPQAAMGANIVNTICEAVGHAAAAWLGQAPLVAILTNGGGAATVATVRLAAATLATKDQPGTAIAARIARLSTLAQVDEDRAVTHNKGIMNGISAAVLATGNDGRAVAAGAHAFAATGGSYQPLATWRLAANGDLCGRIALPLQVGVVGGATGALPVAQAALRLGGYQDVAALQTTLAALGLVQNLAALRALAGPGIQAGHMRLQANALAIAAGATGPEIATVAAGLQPGRMSLAQAQALLAAQRKDDDS